ncbi:hypothetical protein VTJ49DRAFT_6257 [Mycothermus thermophilus]|uniref:RecA family profile 1 domain-containing protein n=1 Tax=Humicola insolens TaxID=85995 RepID=A0ABR3V1N1_HUMIN
MDYHAIHGHDVSSFDLPSTHRLPTVSAAQALEDLEGGIQKGHVTEIWGAPGVGKTAFGIQLAATCLAQEGRVVWVDGFHRLPITRLRAVLGAVTGAQQDNGADADRLGDRFVHYTCPTLPHFLALVCRPTAACIPPGTSLVVIDCLSALVNHAFPKLPETRPAAEAKIKGPPGTVRRLQVLQHISSSLQKLAATRDLAVVVLTQCATKMQAERGATLIPAINASVWEQGISTRLVLFRDWLAQRGAEPWAVRFAAVQKLKGKDVMGTASGACAFTVEERGLVVVEYNDDTQPSAALACTPARKRKLERREFEIADSDDEYYDLDDDELPPMPSQWQGSEDILLGPKPDEDEPEEENALDKHDDDAEDEATRPSQETPLTEDL